MNLLTPLNTLIQNVASAGNSQLVYNLWHIPNVITLMVFCLLYSKKYKIKKLHSILIVAIIYALGLLWILFLGWLASGCQSWGSNNIVKGFIFFPIFALIPAKLFKLDECRIWDFIAPCFPLLQFMAHLACNFAGCCYGFAMEGGIWNPQLEQYLFPIQLLESGVSLLIFVACLLYARKDDFKVTGKVYPFFLITFGITRFFLEFLRNNEKVFGNVSSLALHALFMVLVGCVWFLLLRKSAQIKAENAKKYHHQKKKKNYSKRK